VSLKDLFAAYNSALFERFRALGVYLTASRPSLYFAQSDN
jgi:hypothetical protein